MSLISWNCQGLGAALAVKNLKEEVRKERPQIVFLIETKQHEVVLERIRRRCGFDEAWYVPPVGKSGGLALWWMEDIGVNIINSSKNVINTRIVSSHDQFPAYITFICGPPVEGKRMKVLDQVRLLVRGMAETWLYVGDFNDLLFQNDKQGGNPHVIRRVLNFQGFVSDCELMEIEAKGARFKVVQSTRRRGPCQGEAG